MDKRLENTLVGILGAGAFIYGWNKQEEEKRQEERQRRRQEDQKAAEERRKLQRIREIAREEARQEIQRHSSPDSQA